MSLQDRYNKLVKKNGEGNLWGKEYDLRERRKVKFYHYILLVIIFLPILILTFPVFKGDDVQYISFQTHMNATIGSTIFLSLFFLKLMIIEGNKIYYGYLLSGLIGGALIIGVANIIVVDLNNELIEKNSIVAEQHKKEEKVKFDNRVNDLKTFIDQGAVHDIKSILELRLKYPHQYPKTNYRIMPDQSIRSLSFKGVPLKEGFIANAYFQLGEMYANTHALDEAICYYSKAIEIDSTVSDYHLKLANNLESNSDLAYRHYKKAFELDSTKTWIKSKISKVK